MSVTIKKSNPNRHGYIKLQKEGEGEDTSYFVTEPGNEEGTEFDGDLQAAERFYNEAVEAWSKTPNWRAQAEYDERHGTDNGYPNIPVRGY